MIGTLLDDLLLDYKTNGKHLDWADLVLVVRFHLRPFFGAMNPGHGEKNSRAPSPIFRFCWGSPSW
jgi:hypothetical protein